MAGRCFLEGAVFRMSFRRPARHRVARGAWQRNLHDVLLRQPWCAEESGKSILPNTNRDSNPQGCNQLGAAFIDYGLGANPNPAPDGTRFMDVKPGDVPQFDGLFKAPSLRNTDQRPSPDFVRSYMHNGVFKSLEEVVHFYNKRSVATNSPGQEKAFDWSVGPPAGFYADFSTAGKYGISRQRPKYRWLDARRIRRPASSTRTKAAIAANGQVGDLQLTPQEEADLVNFLKTLTDGYTRPNPVEVVGLFSTLTALAPQPVSGSFVMQIARPGGQFYVVQTSTNLTDWSPVSTNVLTGTSANITNTLMPGATRQFWRVVPEP